MSTTAQRFHSEARLRQASAHVYQKLEEVVRFQGCPGNDLCAGSPCAERAVMMVQVAPQTCFLLHSTEIPFISAGRLTSSYCRPSTIASTISGASSVSRSTRQI